MSYKIMILAPSAGGKSTLTRYLREHTDLHVAETDEEVVKANGSNCGRSCWLNEKLEQIRALTPLTTPAMKKIDDSSIFFMAVYVRRQSHARLR